MNNCIIKDTCPYDGGDCTERCAAIVNYAYASGKFDGAIEITKIDFKSKSEKKPEDKPWPKMK